MTIESKQLIRDVVTNIIESYENNIHHFKQIIPVPKSIEYLLDIQKRYTDALKEFDDANRTE